jgi:hypothetical protein
MWINEFAKANTAEIASNVMVIGNKSDLETDREVSSTEA